jgi:GT2 family glycosyltransferase
LVIPSSCRPDLLGNCLHSVVRYAPAGTEVIVVDDGSERNAVSWVAEGYQGVRVVRRRQRGGFCAAANTGIQAANGGIVELLNDDTEVTADWTGAPLALFQDPTVGAVAPLVLFQLAGTAESPRIDSAGDRYFQGGVAGKRGHGEVLGAGYLNSTPVFGASASSAFYRREALLTVGAFPESFGAYFEDVDLAFRLHRAGYRIIYEPAARILHHGAGSYRAPRRRLLEQQSRNEERVFWRNLPGACLRRAMAHHLAVLAAKTWRRWHEGGLTPFVCGRLRVLGEMPELWRHRRRLDDEFPAKDMTGWQVEARFWE